MDKTPTTRNRLGARHPKLKIGVKNENDACENTTAEQENDYSPLYFHSTQESTEDVEVLWDWHSPQTSQRRRKKQKRLLPVHSPNIPPKRHPPDTQQAQNFDRLKSELKALQEELAMPDDESCLCISPLQETEFKEGQSNTQPNHFEEDDLFNDSIDDQLLLLSQKLENDLNESDDSLSDIFESAEIDNLINKYCNENDETSKTKSLPLQRAVSENSYEITNRNIVHTTSGKLELHRTKSFELTSNFQENKCVLEEIEKKKMEAMAKLESKRRDKCISPCSYEEIEKKRLQALAKLEAKRIEEIVERNRQEALKKLQMNRMKYASQSQVKSTLTKRL